MKIIVYHNKVPKTTAPLLLYGFLTVIVLILAACLQPNNSLSTVSTADCDSVSITAPSVHKTVGQAEVSSEKMVSETFKEDTVLSYPYYEEIPLSEDLQLYLFEICSQQEVPYALALAVIEHESNFDRDAIHHNTNGTIDCGLMQLNEIVKTQVQNDYGVTDLTDPKQNLLAGIGILSNYLSRYDTASAVMAYVNGETGMQRLKQSGITTTESTEEILALMRKYQNLL